MTGANARMLAQVSRPGRSTPQTGWLGQTRPARRRRNQTTSGTSKIAPGRLEPGWRLKTSVSAGGGYNRARRRTSAKARPIGTSRAVEVTTASMRVARPPVRVQTRGTRVTQQPAQDRPEHRDRRHLLDEAQTERDPDHHPPASGVRVVQPLPERERGDRPEQEPRRVGPGDVAVAVDPGHEQERARRHPADPGAIPPGEEAEQEGDRRRVLEDRRQPPRRDVLDPAAEQGVGQEVELAGQGRVEVVAEPGVGPVVEQGFGAGQGVEVGPAPDAGESLPPLRRDELAGPVRRLVPGQADVAGRRDRRARGPGSGPGWSRATSVAPPVRRTGGGRPGFGAKGGGIAGRSSGQGVDQDQGHAELGHLVRGTDRVDQVRGRTGSRPRPILEDEPWRLATVDWHRAALRACPFA